MTPYKFVENGTWPGSRDPLNFWALNVNSSKTVKATDFKFDVRVSRDSPDTIPVFTWRRYALSRAPSIGIIIIIIIIIIMYIIS